VKRLCNSIIMGILAGMVLFTGITASEIDLTVPVSLSFENTPLPAVIQMLADQNDLNIVVSSDVTGLVTVSLDRVTLASALNAILSPNGYNYHVDNNIIMVKSAEKVIAGETETRVYHLKYIDAAAVQTAIAPLLSGNGTALPLGAAAGNQSQGSATGSQTSRLIVNDRPCVHKLVKEFIEKIDRPKRQVSIEVKIIETNLSKDEQLGINWPKSISASISGADDGAGSSDDIDDGSTSDNLAAFMPLESGNWQLGNLSVGQLDMVLDFLTQRNDSKLLSNPRVTTMEDETANIEINTVIPIQTVNRFTEGAVIQDIVTFEDEQVGISLQVTPRICDDSTITMKVTPIVQEIIGYTGPSDNQRPITSERTVTTTVTVKNNETLAMGGLIKETEFISDERVFLLGNIPILGGLFTHKTTEKQNTDLLILITPRILE